MLITLKKQHDESFEAPISRHIDSWADKDAISGNIIGGNQDGVSRYLAFITPSFHRDADISPKWDTESFKSPTSKILDSFDKVNASYRTVEGSRDGVSFTILRLIKLRSTLTQRILGDP